MFGHSVMDEMNQPAAGELECRTEVQHTDALIRAVKDIVRSVGVFVIDLLSCHCRAFLFRKKIVTVTPENLRLPHILPGNKHSDTI